MTAKRGPQCFLVRLLLLVLVFLLAGCGTHYNVAVDSLRDANQPSGTVYVAQPGNEGVHNTDLLFKTSCVSSLPRSVPGATRSWTT